MQLTKPLKCAVIIGLTGLLIIGVLLFLEYKSISVASDNQHLVVLNANSGLYTFYGIAIFLIGVVFTFFALLAYRVLKKNKEVNDALILSEKRFRTIFEEAPLGIALIDAHSGTIHDANPKYMEILGVSKEELGSRNWMSLTHPDDLPESLIYKERINSNSLNGFKLLKRYKRPEGTTVWGNLSVSAIDTREQTHPLYLCILEDITDQRNVEEKIKEVQDKYRSLVDNATDIIMTVDLHDKITFINYAGGGYEREQIIGTSAYNFVAEEYHDLVRQTHENVKKSGVSQTYETISVGLDGVSRCFLTNVSPVFYDDNVAGLTLFTKDITIRKQTEEALRRSENELRKIFSVMEEIIFELNREGKYLKIAPTNPALLYKSAEFLLGKTIRDVFPPEEANFFISRLEECLDENKAVQLEYNLTINDRHIVFEASVSPLTATTVLWVARDITWRKRMQNLLKEKEQNDSLIRYAAQLPGAMYQFRFFPDGNFFFPFVSEGAKELSGLTVEEIKNDAVKVFSIVVKDDFNDLIASIERSMNFLEYWTHEFRIHNPVKGIRWIRGNSKPEMLEDRSILWHGYFNDITDSKLAEEALKISKDKLEAAFNGSNDAIMLLTRKGFFDCNPKTLEMFGLTDRNEFIASHPSDLSPALQPDGKTSISKSNEMIELAFEKGFKRFEWLHKRKSGEVFPAEVLLSAFNYGDEVILQATVHDITERKQAERKLKQNEALLSSILQTLPVAVFGKNIKNNFEFSIWNKKAEEIFGLKAEECVGKTDYDFFPKEDADWYRQKDIEASNTDGILDISEETVVGKNKRVIVHTKKTVVRDPQGEPHFLLGVSEDITEQKEVAEKIRKSEEKYRSVVENAADLIITTDDKSRIQFINHASETSGVESVLGKSIYDFIPGEYTELVRQKLKKIYETKRPQNYEIQGISSNGSRAWYSTNAGPIFSDNEVVGVTLIVRDITERKATEEKTRHSLKEKEILLKEVHHRVKNNLQIILSILNLQYANISDTKTLELLRDVRSRIKAMSFIHELLYQTNDFSSINFSEYISNISTNLIYSYTQKEIELKLDVGSVFLDLDRAIPCGLIVNELLTNALKYAFSEQEEGEVSISLKQTSDYIKLVVADNGKGFPATIDYRNTESLGMQLVMTLVQQLRGEITLDNSNGAKYTITFGSNSPVCGLAKKPI